MAKHEDATVAEGLPAVVAISGADVVGEATVPPPKKVEHFTPAERAARGKATRAEVPRTSHADWEPSSTRPDPVAILEAQGVSREQSLLPIRYGRMLVSPFTFYRGAAALMASDLSAALGRACTPSCAVTPIS